MKGGLIDAGETAEIVEREGIGGSADVSGDCGDFGDGGEREVEGIEGELAVGARGEVQVEVTEDDIALREMDGAGDIAADDAAAVGLPPSVIKVASELELLML